MIGYDILNKKRKNSFDKNFQLDFVIAPPILDKYRRKNMENLSDTFFCEPAQVDSRAASPAENCEIDKVQQVFVG